MLCAGSTLLLTPVVRPANSQLATPLVATLFSYWSIKPWFHIEGKLVTVLIIPSSWGSQRTATIEYQQDSFLAPLPGRQSDAIGESFTSNLFILFLSCLVSLVLFCLPLLKNTKKIVPFLVAASQF